MKAFFIKPALLWVMGLFVVVHAAFSQSLIFTVNSVLDAPDAVLNGICDDGTGKCTLRAAIQEANFNNGRHDVILFNIPGTGPHSLLPLTNLPALSDNAGVTIDGLSEPGSSAGANPPASATLMIELDGSAAVPILPATIVHGLHVLSDSNDIRGLVINRFDGDGIRIEGTIETTEYNFVYCNFIGTNIAGTVGMGNGVNSTPATWYAGVSIIVPPCGEPRIAMHNTVSNCLISGNGYEGVSITNCPPGDVAFNIVENSWIGIDKSGNLAIPNDRDGVTIAEAAHDNHIRYNVISGNKYSGIGINGLSSPPRYTYSNIMNNNLIGLNAAGTAPIPNIYQGVSIGMYGPSTWGFAPNNVVRFNTIAFNQQNGVLVVESPASTNNCDGNLISHNSIYSNMKLGIDLDADGVTNNDLSDVDAGANQGCNFPVINAATINAGSTTITGTVSFPNPNLGMVEVFQVLADPSTFGEGKTYLGTAFPNATGNWSMTTTTGNLTLTDALTATSIDANNNTSEFSQNFTNILSPVENVVVEEGLFQAMPNPATGSVHVFIKMSLVKPARLEITNRMGQVIRTMKLGYVIEGQVIEMNLGDLVPGIYFLKLTDGTTTGLQQLVIQQ